MPWVSKRELSLILRISRQTLDTWLDRYGDDFPVVERGSNGREYRFDPQAVIDFLRDKQEEQKRQRAAKDEALAQLMLPIATLETPAGPSLDDRLKAEKLNHLVMARSVRSRTLVPAAEVTDLLATIFADQQRSLQAFLHQLAREQNWPEPILRANETRLAELQRSFVTRMQAFLTPAEDADAPRLAFG